MSVPPKPPVFPPVPPMPPGIGVPEAQGIWVSVRALLKRRRAERRAEK